MNRRVLFFLTVSIFSTLLCNLPENPRNIDNAGIEKQTLTSLPSKVPVNSVYQCTLSVLYPEFVDSFAVVASINGGAKVKIAGAAIGDDTIALFALHLSEAGNYTVNLFVYKSGLEDTASVTFTVFGTIPVVAAKASRVIASIDTTVTLQFTATDPDSNLVNYIIRQGADTLETKQFFASERASATINRELTAAFLKTLHDTLIRFSVTLMDADNQMSAAALCTLVVKDTMLPIIKLLPPHNDSVRVVAKLPDTIRAIVRDNWSIDSVKFTGNRVVVLKGDTARVVLAKLDSGKTVDTLEAWDPAGNHRRVPIALRYNGPKVFPPKIVSFFQSVNEGDKFDTVFLDQKVTITDTAAKYGKSALHWSVTVDSLGSGMSVALDTTLRILVVSGPTGEIFNNRTTSLTLTVTDPAGISAIAQGTFILVEKNDPPLITLKGQGKKFDVPFDTLKLDTCGYDPEKNTQLVWSISRGKWFVPVFLKETRCTGVKLEKATATLPICRDVLTGKVVIRPDTIALAGLASTLDAMDTLLFSLKSIAANDTVEVFKKVPYSWGRLKIYIPIEIPQFYKP